MAKTFILGIGAQRSGSTWLHSQLNKNTEINMGLCKEYHVFDTVFTEYFSGYEKRLRDSLSSLSKSDHKYGKNLKLLSFLENTENYFDYFDELYSKNKATIVVGDMTPSYSMLSAGEFQFIREGLERKGFNVKVVFIMRDPVQRIWSMIHKGENVEKNIVQRIWSMIHKGENVEKNIEFFQSEEKQFSLDDFTHTGASMRTRYDRTIVEVEKVFAKKNIYYGFYEDIFKLESYLKLGRFLGLELGFFDLEFKINPSLMKEEIDHDLATQVALHYRDTYHFIQSRFGDQVTNMWPGYVLINSVSHK